MPATTVVHLTHTDPRVDSRIAKQLSSLNAVPGVLAIGVGVNHAGLNMAPSLLNERTACINLWSARLTRLPRSLRHALTMIELLPTLIWKAYRLSPAVVHCHDTMVLSAGVVVKWVTGCKLVYDAHELESQKNQQTSLMSRVTLWIERIFWRHIDTLVSVSESIVVWYRNHLGAKDAVVVMNAPVYSEHASESWRNEYLREKCGIPEGELICVYVGVLGPGRGIDLILEAFQEQDIQAHIVFIGYGEFAERIRGAARHSPRVHLHDPVPHTDVVPLVASADVGLCLVENVSLSDYYCLPNKLFEYAFAGLRVIASDFPEMRNVVRENDLGVCCELSVQGLRQALRSIRKCKTNRDVDLSDLSWQAQEARLVAKYRELLSTV